LVADVYLALDNLFLVGRHMIIWGSTTKEIEIGAGHFHCPACNGQRLYRHFRRAAYFTLYFIPLWETNNLGEVIQCFACKRQFKREILSYVPPKPEQIR